MLMEKKLFFNSTMGNILPTMILPQISLLQKCFQLSLSVLQQTLQPPSLLYTVKGAMVNKSLTAQTPPWERQMNPGNPHSFITVFSVSQGRVSDLILYSYLGTMFCYFIPLLLSNNQKRQTRMREKLISLVPAISFSYKH